MSPIEVIDEVVVAGGPGAAHRAWPSIERTADGDLLVAYKVGPDHHKTDDGGRLGGSLGGLAGRPGRIGGRWSPSRGGTYSPITA